MCGIAGYAAKPGIDPMQLRALTALLALEMLSRGSHSWGYFDDTTILKGVGPIHENLILPTEMPATAVIHTRWATHGNVSEENAHPFKFATDKGPLTGCHNGVLSNHDKLNEKYNRNFAVDSQHIFAHLAQGMTSLEDLRGYGAIVYHAPDAWYFGTFNNGDLTVANTAIGKVFASTQHAVKTACHLLGIKIDTWDILLDNNIYRFDSGTSYQAFKVHTESTTSRWNDYVPSKSLRHALASEQLALRHALAKKPLILPPPEDKRSCVECLDLIFASEQCFQLPNSGRFVCEACALANHSTLAPSDYTSVVNANCGLCGLCDVPGIRVLHAEADEFCDNCFSTVFNVSGLTVVNSLISDWMTTHQ